MFHFSTPRQARVFTLGEPNASVRELWLVFHGYGQLAEYFIQHFKPLDDASRWIIAPEALSRFYLQMGGGRVGASWMTKEDRLTEIEDQLTYLNALVSHVKEQLLHEAYQIHVVGFSQGVATAWRWLMQGEHTVDSLTLWAGKSPEEYPEEGMKRLKAMKLFMARGTEDPFITDQRATEEIALLKDKFPHIQAFSFEGKHEINEELLLKIAALLRN